MLQVIPYHLGAFFARFTPDWFCRMITWTLAEVNWRLRPGTRRVVAANLGTIHPEWGPDVRRAVARRVVHNFARSILLFLQLPFLKPDELAARCDVSELRREIEGVQRRADAKAAPGATRPFIVASAHLGPWELGGYCLSRLGFEVHGVALDHPSARVTRFFSDRRAYLGLHAHPISGSFPMLRDALARGGCVALLIDRAYGKAKKRFALFGVESEFPLGHLVLSARCHAPVLTGALVFDGLRRIRYVHGGTHFPDDEDDEFEKLERLQEKCMRDLERIIRAHSDQWFHFTPLARTEAHGHG
jgi:lauroyl/myristoyl acyltransferase